MRIASTETTDIFCKHQKDTANPLLHHVIARSNRFNFAQAFAPKKV